MRLTIEIDADDMSRIRKTAGKKKKSPAVSQALTEYLKLRERQEFMGRVLAGKTDYSLSNEQLEARDLYETPFGCSVATRISAPSPRRSATG